MRKVTKAKKVGGMSQVVEHLPSNHQKRKKKKIYKTLDKNTC
jgi:signal recognition particle GTPase